MSGDDRLITVITVVAASLLIAYAMSSCYGYAEAFGLTPCIDGRWGWGDHVCAHPDQRGPNCACEVHDSLEGS